MKLEARYCGFPLVIRLSIYDQTSARSINTKSKLSHKDQRHIVPLAALRILSTAEIALNFDAKISESTVTSILTFYDFLEERANGTFRSGATFNRPEKPMKKKWL
ncbi:hypothetical protein TNIN_412491 [Trichonephila inaurata madagascariensis]|uniref:Uncharacterized protein n=1 Tax=Trichonephila inaurata madagascariensis TaxID=2747483 RepID=A0A8X6YAP7_9ARAC|nr:hypothetical protein TNIN_412491 [Trichonephila inaurata madagascariensis]